MTYRGRQGPPTSGDPMPTSTSRDRYLDNCFLLCINRDDDKNVPEVRRLEDNIMRELCGNPLGRGKSQQEQQRMYRPQQNDDVYDDVVNSKQRDRDGGYRQKGNQRDYYPESQTTNRSRYQRDNDTYYGRDRQDLYSRGGPSGRRDDYGIMQHSDDELSVYEVYVPTNTLHRLSDKRADNNMVLIDYEDASMMRNGGGSPLIHGHQSQYSRNVPSQYGGYSPVNQYDDLNQPYHYDNSRGQQSPQVYGGRQPYQNHPLQPDRHLYSPQSGPFLPANVISDPGNTINVRRHIYSPSQLPQGLTEGQLVMLLQKGAQSSPGNGQQTQNLYVNKEPQSSTTTTAVSVAQQPSPAKTPVASSYAEPSPISQNVPLPPVKISPAPPQIIDHHLTDEIASNVLGESPAPVQDLQFPSRMSKSHKSSSMKHAKDTGSIGSKGSGDKKKDMKKESSKDNKKDSKKRQIKR